MFGGGGSLKSQKRVSFKEVGDRKLTKEKYMPYPEKDRNFWIWL